MKYKHIVGLDIGTNSLGWCIIKEYENGDIEIIKTGVHVFPIGTIVDDKSNKEKTKNEQRRSYRGASRLRYRFKLRRGNLKEILSELGMLPDNSELIKPFTKKEKKQIDALKRAQSYKLYKLRADAINPNNKLELKEIGRIFMLLNKYRGFKSNAKKLQKKDNEAGEVEKGYKRLQLNIDNSGAKTIGEYFFKMHEKAKKWFDENKWHNANEPIDERAYNDSGEFILFNSNGIRRHHGRYTLRDMYYHEFDLIWAVQKKYYPQIFTGDKTEYEEILQLPYKERIKALKDFKQTNYWHIRDYCIYYQRPLKSQKKYVSNCQFERGNFDLKKYIVVENGIDKIKEKRVWKKKAKKACPKSHPYFQEFRIWQKLHQISYSSIIEDVFNKPLKTEWIKVLAETLMQNFEIFLNKTPKVLKENKLWFGKILQEKRMIQNADDYTFHIDKADEDIDHEEKNENRITGNLTYASFLEALGEKTFNELKNETTKRIEAINTEEVTDIEESKLLQLWHHLYIAKDGLFKEDDWLKCILTEKTKWDFTPEQAQRLIEMGLQPDYGSYSSKVLKIILPEMRKGLNEHEALKAVNREYINEDNTVGEQVKLKEKISQLRYNELRNPVVERALSKTIKLLNAILEKYKNEIDKENFEIRVESTRQFKKPRQERENERKKDADKNKLREQYSLYLTKNKEKLGFKKDIYKYDPIVGKYELWLQMNMNESDEVFLQEFKAFSKITKPEEKLKHRLWLECGRMCPYTGRIINLTDCFSSEVEIEHIIPLSRGLDDSFNNKTLTYCETNALKGSMTPIEFLQKSGENALKEFKRRMNSKYHGFSDSKKNLFLATSIPKEFSNNQLSNTSYIAKYARKKMQEVCKNVQFTNGSATSELRNKDWSLSNLLDKIRYEEDFGINMDSSPNEPGIYSNYYRIKKSFLAWCEKKYNTTDIIIDWSKLTDNKDAEEYISQTNDELLFWHNELEKFKQFRNKDGKKDRSDHRHHAIDAFVTACCSPAIIKELSTYNAVREEQHLEYRGKVDKRFNYTKLKESIAAILVSHSEKQTLVKKRKNKIKTREGIKEQFTYAPQGKLHEESFYAKRNGATIRRVELFDNQRQEKALFDTTSDLDYSVKGVVKWNYIDDNQLYEITKRRLEELKTKAFTKEEMEKNPFYRTSPSSPEKFTSKKKNKPLPIVKSVRKRFNTDRTLIHLPAKDEAGNIIYENRYADNDSNYVIAFYTNGNKSFARPISFFKAVKAKQTKKLLLPDEIVYRNIIYGLNSELPWLKNGDIVFICSNGENIETVDWNDFNFLKNRIFKVKGFSTLITPNPTYGNYEFGNTSLLNIRNVKASSYPSQKKVEDALNLKAFTLSHDKFRGIKLRLNILGEIEAKGEECF
jgi:CRISPR-associated endonuclease Csn1